MDCEQIEKILREIKPDKLGRLRGKNKAVDKLHVLCLNHTHWALQEVKVNSARAFHRNRDASAKDLFKKVDKIITDKQTSF